MRIIKIISLFFPLLYIGCGDIEENYNNKLNLEQQNSDNNVTLYRDKKDLLKELGLNIENEKISFDINKTTDFFKKMEIEMHGKADKIQSKIERADINFTRDIGINFSNEKVEIDLNKTKKMFQQINILMKEVLLDGNSSKY